jgi:hypothetical protein
MAELQRPSDVRAIDGPDLPCPGLRLPFHYGLEPGSSYGDFQDKLETWSKDVSIFPSVVQM